MPTWIETVVLLGALCRLGVRQEPVLPIYGERELTFILDQCGASAFIVPGNSERHRLRGDRSPDRSEARDVPHIVCDHELPAATPRRSPPLPADRPRGTRWIFYTSGTTADPKGARHTDHP